MVEVGPYPKRLAWWAKLATWRPKCLLGGQSSHLGKKLTTAKRTTWWEKCFTLHKALNLRPKCLFWLKALRLCQNSSIVTLKKSRLVPKRTMKFSQSQKRTGVGATLKNAIETFTMLDYLFCYIWSSSSVFSRTLVRFCCNEARGRKVKLSLNIAKGCKKFKNRLERTF